MASPKALAAIALTLIIAAPICLGFAMSSETVEYTAWETEKNINLSETIYNAESPIYMDFNGSANNTYLLGYDLMDYVQHSSNPTAYPVRTPVTSSKTFNNTTWTAMPSGYWIMTIPADTSWELKSEDGRIHGTLGDTVLSGFGDSIKMNPSRTITVTTFTFSTSDYADASYGWKLPDRSSTWYNQMTNRYVDMVVDIPDNSKVVIGAYRLEKNADGEVFAAYGSTGGTLQPLGVYPYVKVRYSTESIQVSGLLSWPGMGVDYITYNTVTVENPNTPSSAHFERMALVTDEYADVIFRIDNAYIESGSFPWSVDASLDMASLFPAKSYSLKLNSIGIYGDSLTIGGTTYSITNNRITVGGQPVPLKGAVISSRYNGSTYDLYISGHEAGTTAAPASITFDGGWSLTVTGQILKQVTNEKAQWEPGGFAFDKDSFVGVIVLAAALAFIGIGIYGARSGIKVGLLLLICGGAALIALSTL